MAKVSDEIRAPTSQVAKVLQRYRAPNCEHEAAHGTTHRAQLKFAG